MPLKLTVSNGDKIEIGEGKHRVVATVLTGASTKVCIEFDAPRSVEINTVFLDPSQGHKNARKAQGLSPEQQRESALNQLRGRK